MEQTIEQKPIDLTKRKYFNILDGAMACIGFVALQYIIYFLMGVTGGIQNHFMYEFWSIALQSCFVLAVIITAKARRVDWIHACTLKNKINGKVVLYALLISVICLFAFNNLTSAFGAILEKLGYVSPFETGDYSEYNQITNIGQFLIAIFTTCIVPPLCEEILFRGAVLNSFRGLNKWVAILISGFMFMIMHGNPDQTIFQFMLGCVLSYVAWETKNIWICVIIHAINNFIAICIQFYYGLLGDMSSGEVIEGATEAVTYSWGDIIFTAIYGIAWAALGIFLVIKLVKRMKACTQTAPQTQQNQPEMVVQTAESNEAVVITEESEVQPKPSKQQVILTVLLYIAFASYFIKSWITYLLTGLGVII